MAPTSAGLRFEVPEAEMPAFEAFLEALDYRYQRENINTAYDLFLAR